MWAPPTASFYFSVHAIASLRNMLISFNQIFLNVNEPLIQYFVYSSVCVNISCFPFLITISAAPKNRSKSSGEDLSTFLGIQWKWKPSLSERDPLKVAKPCSKSSTTEYSLLVQMASNTSTSLQELVISCLVVANPAGQKQHLTDFDLTDV